METEASYITPTPTATIAGLTLEGLESRYSVTRSTVFDRIKKLRDRGFPINPDKHPVYSSDDIDTLDGLNTHLKIKGATIANFSPYQHTVELSSDSPTTDDISTPVLIELVQAIALAIAVPVDPLANLEALERAAAHGWLLSTSQVRALIGGNPTGAVFIRHGFGFESAGRNGREAAWKVTNPRNVARDWSRND